MRFKRLLMPMLVLGVMVTLSSMAFGQASPINCSISAPQGASAHATATGHTEPVAAGPTEVPLAMTAGGAALATPEAGGGTIRVTCANTSAVAVDPGVVVLTVSLATPITNSQTFPTTGIGIRITRASGDFFPPGPTSGNSSAAPCNVGISSTSNSGGTIAIGLGTTGDAALNCTSSGVGGGTTARNPVTGILFSAAPAVSTFDLEGILVSTNGKTGNVTATLTSGGGVNISVGAVEVITAVSNGLVDPTVPTAGIPAAVVSAPVPAGFTQVPGGGVAGGPAVLNSSGGPVKNNFVIRIQEGYPDMFKESGISVAGQGFNGGGVFPVSNSSDTQVLVQFTNIPSGFDISGCSAFLTDVSGNVTVGTPTASQSNVTSASPIITVNFNAEPDQTALDVLWLACTKVSVGSAALPLPSTPVAAQVSLGPTGAALSSTSGVLTTLITGQIPRYNQSLQPAVPLTVVVFPPANTALLLTFAFVGPGYNTGVAVANTTTDPFTPAAGGAAASEGTVSFLLVKNDGTTKAYTTTTGSPGGGLTGAGIVKSGSTYIVNLSEILSAASFGTTFSGYVFITANFTHAHGAATIYTTSNGAAALSTPVLVVQDSKGGGISAGAPRTTPEGLGQ